MQIVADALTILQALDRVFRHFQDWLLHFSPAEVSAIAESVLALLGVIGLPIALVQLSFVRKAQKAERTQGRIRATKELLNTYLREYRTPLMGRAVAGLWNLHRLAGGDRRKIIELYVRLYRNDKRKKFHFEVRRRVSTFYQQLALLIERDELARAEVYRMWNRGDLRLIPEVLIPIEIVAIPQILGNPEADLDQILGDKGAIIGHATQLMLDLYRNAPGEDPNWINDRGRKVSGGT